MYRQIIVIFAFIISIFGVGMAQTMDTVHNNENIIIGETTLEQLSQNAEFWQEYRENYDKYSLDEKKIEKISNALDNTKYEKIIITAVIGTWCGDTKEQFPVFQKIFDHLQHQKIRIEYIGVGRDKLTWEKQVSNLGIEFVPTFLFYAIDRGTSERKYPFFRRLGCIIETPEGTMEDHILKILSGKE